MTEILNEKLDNGTWIKLYNVKIKYNNGEIGTQYMSETSLKILKLKIELEKKGIDNKLIDEFESVIRENQRDEDYMENEE